MPEAVFSTPDTAGGDGMDELKTLLAEAIKHKPTRVSLKIVVGKNWEDSKSVVAVNDAEVPFNKPISFTQFGEAVKEAFREAYGDLKVVPISFREELLVNDQVMLRYVPTGSMGIFDIYVVYKD